MTTRYDLITGRKSKDGSKTYWTKVGVAFPSERGGFSIELEAYPLPDSEGKVRMLMVEPRQNDGPSHRDAPPAGNSYAAARGMAAKPQNAAGGAPMRPALDDEVPFACEWRG